jgi:tRNA pseudouridine55 synthase
MHTADDFKNGQLLLIDKPLNWTSFQVVNKLRGVIRKRFDIRKIKVGHAGTLDPLATGLLIICVGKLTKQINTFQAQEKTYTGTFTLGASTPSYDLETEIDNTYPTAHITPELIYKTSLQFMGTINQKPPLFSAIWKDGRRLYNVARAGETVEIEPRQVEIKRFDITKIDFPKLDFLVTCSKGTYIRSLAHDFGLALNSGAHLSALRRTKIGDFKVNDAMTIDGFIESL